MMKPIKGLIRFDSSFWASQDISFNAQILNKKISVCTRPLYGLMPLVCANAV